MTVSLMQWLRFLFRSLRHRECRLFFIGQCGALVGGWMQTLAMNWLVFKIAGSASMLGFVYLVNQGATFLVAPLAGVYLDRLDRRKVYRITQGLTMMLNIFSGILVFTGSMTLPHVFIINLIMGLVSGVDMPAGQTMLSDVTGRKEDLGNVIALNGALINGAKIVGPLVAGVVVDDFGLSACFILSGLCYVTMLIALSLFTVKPAGAEAKRGDFLKDFREGFRYVCTSPAIMATLALYFLLCVMNRPMLILRPAFVGGVFSRGAEGYGLLMAAMGAGSLCGALYMAAMKDSRGMGKVLVVSACLLGLGQIGFSLAAAAVVMFFCELVIGIGMRAQMVASNTYLQEVVDEGKRGRVMSFFSTTFVAASLIGDVIAAEGPALLTLKGTLMWSGVLCIAGGLLFLPWLPLLRKTTEAHMGKQKAV
ncbi:MAG: MFS transporter [Candidatus Eremiobacteraeota bacterium]|nr:MFS transporter [Candidatus Eremiobacteraeota bacterium]